MWLFVALLVSIGILWLFSGTILRGIGSILVNDGPPVKADAIVVLAGDGKGRRILQGAELGRQGFAPVVIASNGGDRYDRFDSSLAIEFAVHRGYNPGLFVETNWEAHSTQEEAQKCIAFLRSRGARRVLIVTTPWHTARAARIYGRAAPDLDFFFVGANDGHWKNGKWWKEREGRKELFLEYAKTIANFLGI